MIETRGAQRADPASRPGQMSRILVVEDSRDIADGIALNLTLEGHEVQIARDGERGLAACRMWEPELVVLDLLLPGLDGYAVLQALRTEGREVPVLILSALGGEDDRLRGFRVGADDFLVKPFALRELLARVTAILRRSTGAQRGVIPDIRHGALLIASGARRVTLGDAEITMRGKAFDLLVAFALRPDTVLRRDHLLRDIWGYAPGVESRTLDWHVSYLRKRLADEGEGSRLIESVRAVGYRFNTAVAHALAPAARTEA